MVQWWVDGEGGKLKHNGELYKHRRRIQLSSSTDICHRIQNNASEINKLEWNGLFGENCEKRIPNSDNDLHHLLKKVDGQELKPRLYQCCGT